jgi:hypothetical protein
MEKITFTADDGETAEFFVLEQTTVGGINYILVTDSEEGDGDALILKDLSAPDAEDADYEIVSDDEELKSISGVFENLLEDIKFS